MSKDTVKTQCPSCGRKLKIPTSKSGKSIVCPQCNNKFKFDQPIAAGDAQEELTAPIGNKFSAGLFEEDIDDLLADAPKPAPKPKKKVRKRKQLKYQSQQASTQNQPVDEEDPQAAWQNEKRVTTDRQESLHRNGVGLIILAIGLAMLPFFARSVEALSPVLPYLPIAAVVLAFFASFMIALSLRRSNIGTILISGFPFLLICLLALGSYFYTRTQTPVEPVAQTEVSDQEEPVKGNDKFTIDRDRIEENAASKFVPPLKAKPKVSDFVEQPRQSQPEPVAPEAKVPESNLDPRAIVTPRKSRFERDDQSGDFEQQLRLATRHANNSDKLQALLEREKRELQKGLVSNDTIKSPLRFNDKWQLSNVAGRKTVYGVVYYLGRGINGLDVAHHPDDVDRFFDIFMPISRAAQFEDSIASSAPSSRFVGLNVIASVDGISGLQGVFRANDQEVLTDWVGESPERGTAVEKLRVESERLIGIVVYRNQLKATGIRLVGSSP